MGKLRDAYTKWASRQIQKQQDQKRIEDDLESIVPVQPSIGDSPLMASYNQIMRREAERRLEEQAQYYFKKMYESFLTGTISYKDLGEVWRVEKPDPEGMVFDDE